MLTIDRFTDMQGRISPGFFVRNRAKKVLAIGAFACDRSFVMPTRKRYARDVSLCVALLKLTGCPVKWNLSYWGKRITSGSEQELQKLIRRTKGSR